MEERSQAISSLSEQVRALIDDLDRLGLDLPAAIASELLDAIEAAQRRQYN